jgi:hypothetical protein
MDEIQWLTYWVVFGFNNTRITHLPHLRSLSRTAHPSAHVPLALTFPGSDS